MQLTQNEKEMLESLLNSDFFTDSADENSTIFLAYLDTLTNEEKGIIGSLVKKHVIEIEYETDYDEFNHKIRLTDVWLNCLGKDKERFIETNLNNIGVNFPIYQLKDNYIEDSTLDL